MDIHDPLWWQKAPYHSKGLAPAIEAQEPRRLAHAFGTPRHPRRAATWQAKYRAPRPRSRLRGGLAEAVAAQERRVEVSTRFTKEKIAHYRRLWREAER